MSETKHTPGPWAAALTPAGKSKVVDANGFSVALCQHGAYSQQTYDAHLIAAAPDMLEALEAALAYLVMAGTDHAEPTRASIRAAIKKARGEK